MARRQGLRRQDGRAPARSRHSGAYQEAAGRRAALWTPVQGRRRQGECQGRQDRSGDRRPRRAPPDRQEKAAVTHGGIMRRAFAPAAFVILAAATTAAADAPRLALPIDCILGQTCYIEDYVDTDPGPGQRDYMCGLKSRD